MEFEIVSAADVPLATQAHVANAAFANYVGGWAEMDAAMLSRFLLLQGADLFHSRFLRMNGELVGFGYITRTANVSRLSGMALVPPARGTGAAAHLLEHLFAEAEANGDRAMLLEVIEQNPRAQAVYQRHGFRQLTRLVGARLQPDVHRGDERLAVIKELPLLDALRLAN